MALLTLLRDASPDVFSVIQLIVNAGAALIAGIATALVAIWVYRRQQSQAEADKIVKKLVYEVISDAPIANINQSVAEHVEIRFDGQPVKDLYLLILQIKNSGNVAVKPNDYAEPLQIIFKGNRIVSADIYETNPMNLIPTNDLKSFLTLSSDAVKLAIILLNPTESISIKVLLTGSQRDLEIRARIADTQLVTVHELEAQQKQAQIERRRSSSMLLIFGTTAHALGSITIGIGIARALPSYQDEIAWWAFLALIIYSSSLFSFFVTLMNRSLKLFFSIGLAIFWGFVGFAFAILIGAGTIIPFLPDPNIMAVLFFMGSLGLFLLLAFKQK